jgi:antirestriction protein ArdC
MPAQFFGLVKMTHRLAAPSPTAAVVAPGPTAACAGLPDGIAAPPPPVDASLILPQVEELIRATGADVRIGGDKAYYDVAGDYIRVPPPQAFYNQSTGTDSL